MNQTIVTNSSTNLDAAQGWDALQNSFAKVYRLKNSDHREYELHQAAQQFQIPVEVYRSLYQSYNQAQLLNNGQKVFRLLGHSPQKALKKTLDILSRLGWLSMLGVVAALSLQLVELWEREEYVSWAIVSLNQGKAANGGRSLALETLAMIDSNLTGLNIENAVLPKLDLSGSDLLQGNFSQANLMQANLSNTQLVYANLQGTYLESADLSGANFEFANLQGAQLLQANLNDANLERANLQQANLSNTNLSTARNLDSAILAGAFYNARTQFPKNFNPKTAGAILLEPNTDLSNANLAGMMLSQVNLSGVNLTSADLSDAFLVDVNLSGANLKGANFENAIGLTSAQIKTARNWQQATFDPAISQELGL